MQSGYHAKGLSEPTSELESYAQEVIEEMIRQSIPPTPLNFDTYFDKLLDDKPPAFRKRILNLLELEDTKDMEHQGTLERYLKDAFANVKKFMQHINLLYKNLKHLETLVEKRSFEIEAIADKVSLNTLIESTKKDIQTMQRIIKKEAKELKERYKATSELVQEVQDHAIYDEKFGVYKKNHFFKKLKQEKKLIKEFKHESTVMMVKASDEVLDQIKSPKIRHLVLRTIARLLLKTSRRSDLIAHYDDGVFAILMRHTSLQNAKLAAERLKDLVGNTNFFVGDQEIMLDVEIGIARVDLDRSTEQTIVCALEGVEIARKSDEACGFCPQDIEI